MFSDGVYVLHAPSRNDFYIVTRETSFCVRRKTIQYKKCLKVLWSLSKNIRNAFTVFMMRRLDWSFVMNFLVRRVIGIELKRFGDNQSDLCSVVTIPCTKLINLAKVYF